tara:strand:+ start:188 stop:502 length:315 start_codon:yes stop_codon:yes gene_type:complete
MTTFDNVSVVKAANVYFDGKVTSRTVIFSDGSKKTLGIMSQGEYEFGTELKEIMEIINGNIDVLLPGSQQWQSFHAGDSFEVPANASFNVKVLDLTDYCCSYVV